MRPAVSAHYWFDATELALDDADPVAQWDDISGNARHVVSSGGARPTLRENQLNGLPVVRFDGTDDYLRHTYAGSGDQFAHPLTIVAVARRSGATERQYLYDSGYAGGDQNNFRNTLALKRSNNLAIYTGVNSSLWRVAGASDTEWRIFTVTVNGASSSLRVDRVPQAVTGSAGTSSARGLTLGANFNNSADFLEGDIAEFVFCPALDPSDVDAVEQYLADKWGFPDPPVFVDGSFGSFTGSNKWAFGCLSSVSGKVYCAPYVTNDGVLVIDPANSSTSLIPITARQVGMIEGGDGRLYSPPEASGGHAIVVDPTDDTVEAFDPTSTAWGSNRTWYDGAMAPNGAVYCPPTRSANYVLKLDPAGTATLIGSNHSTSGDSKEWGGAVTVGDVIYCPPRHGGTVLRIDTTDDTTSQIGSALTSTARAWSGGVLCDGRVFFVPKNETSVLVLDPSDESFSHINGLPAGDDKWASAIVHNGLVFMFPRQSSSVLVIDPSDDSYDLVVADVQFDFATGNRFIGAVKVGNRVYSAPGTSTKVARWAFTAPPGIALAYWDGSTERTLSLSHWDGTTETPVTLEDVE